MGKLTKGTIYGARRGVESGIWMTRAGSWKLLKYSQNPGGPPPSAFRHSVSGSPGVFEPYRSSFFFLMCRKLGILESGNCDHFTGTACTHVSRSRKAFATLQGPRRAQRLGRSARRCSARRGRLGIASEQARILAAPADARRIESRAALRAVTFSAVMAV